MYKIDLKVPFLNLAGNSTRTSGDREVLLGNELAEILGAQSGNIKVRKAMGWARALARGDILSLDDSDKKDLAEFVENQATMTNNFKIQVLEILDEAKKE